MDRRQLLFFIILFVLVGIIGSVFAQIDQPRDEGWSVEKRADRTFYFTHGTIVRQNEFGFIKGDDCESDILWLTFSFSSDRVKDFEGKEAVVLLQVDGRDFKVKLPIVSIGTSGASQAMTFTNWRPSKQLMDALKSGRYVKVEISGPRELEGLLGIKEDQFSLRVFVPTRKEAGQVCKNITSGIDWLK